MATDLKKQTTLSLIWNGIDKVGYQVIAMCVSIITARLLSPTDFGYIAALALFTAISSVLVEGGFTAALVRRKDNTNEEYTAAMLFNIVLSVVFYIVLYIAAPLIADYYGMPPLTNLARVIFLTIIVNAFSIVPNIILTRLLRFRELAAANLASMVISSVITIAMAVSGFGYWAIAAQQLSQAAAKAAILSAKCSWHPTKTIQFRVIGEIFNFSALLIVSSLISNGIKYIYNFYIGPRYSSDDLGYYGQSYKFTNIITTVISSTLTGVGYPVLSSLNDDRPRQLLYLQKIIRITAFITFPAVLGLILTTSDVISVILTDKWLPMAHYFQLLLASSLAVPFYNIYANFFTVVGRPRLYFIMEFIRNGLIVLLLLLLHNDITQIIHGYILASFLSLIIAGIIISRITSYSITSQLRHLFPPLLLSGAMCGAIAAVSQIQCATWLQLLLQITVGAASYISLAYIFKMQIFNDMMTFIKKDKNI